MRRRLLFGFLLSIAAWGQDLGYTLLAAQDPRPTPRNDGALAYDPVRREVFVFGGMDPVPRDDLWSYSLTQRRWTEIRPSGDRPDARFGHTLLFDPVRNRLIVFGGQNRGFFSDVWAFDLSSTTWRRLSADEAGPSRRYGHSAIYESARDRMVISHGFTTAGRFDDTWAFDFATNTWRDLSPSGPRPLRRCLHRAAYDPDRGQMYLYGGCSSGFGPCPQGDLWTFDLATNRWTERTRPGPAPRENYGMVFHKTRDRLLIFGGSGAGLLNDTWEFDPRSDSWHRLSVAGALPSARQRHEAVYGSDRGAVYFFGGSTATGLSNELWTLGPAFANGTGVTIAGYSNAFSGVSGAVAPGELVSIYGAGLGPEVGFSLGFDELSGKLPTSGPGVDVTWNGIRAPLLYLSTEQLNVQVPYELSGASEARLVVTVNGQSSEPKSIPAAAVHPGLHPRVWNQDGSINSPQNPAVAGSIVVLYATGQGLTNPASVSGAYPREPYPEPVASTMLKVGGIEAPILFRGQAPGTAGVMQLNVRVPQGTPANEAVPVVLSLGGVETQTGVSVAVQ